jgi:hypothetical protein
MQMVGANGRSLQKRVPEIPKKQPPSYFGPCRLNSTLRREAQIKRYGGELEG